MSQGKLWVCFDPIRNDELDVRLLDDLSHCHHTARIDVPWDCEPLASHPE